MQGDTGLPDPPAWLTEEGWLRDLLGWFLDRLEQPRSRAITRRIKRSTVPALFRFDGLETYRWELLQHLASEHGMYSIHYERKTSGHQERYENAQLRLNPECEELLRHWLQRPRIDPMQAAWRQAVLRQQCHFADGGTALLVASIAMGSYHAGELVAAFAAVGDWLGQGLTLREIAARCFRGDSKFLDGRQELLTKCYGEQASGIAPRPLLLTAFAPPDFEHLLIVENQDSFLRLVGRPPRGHALLYSGGFRASAQRLASAHTRFAFLPGSDNERFARLWLSAALPVYFWGDLDFAGMGILKALRHSLPGLTAWQAGYAPMLTLLQNGGGHSAEQGGKTAQTDPGETGCTFADRLLLPALRQHQCCVDQEVVSPD
jgi:Uncharacterized protein conserved in bacteria C-term(DUF2220)